MTNRLRYGAHELPNQRAIQSRLERVSSDMSLTNFYGKIASRLSNKTVTAESFLEVWYEELAQLHGDSFEFVAINFIPYAKQLFWSLNPYFCQVVMGQYVKPSESTDKGAEISAPTVVLASSGKGPEIFVPTPEVEPEVIEEPVEQEVVKTEEETQPAKETVEKPEELSDLENMSVSKLRDFADKHGVDIEGKRSKNEIREAINAYFGLT